MSSSRDHHREYAPQISGHHRDTARPDFIPAPVFDALRDWEAAR